jgi:hypothetical protein
MPFSARVKRGAVSRVSRRECRHAECLIISPMVEERLEVGVFYVPQHDHKRNVANRDE